MAADQAADLGYFCPHARVAGGTQAPYCLREREVPEPLGVLEQRNGPSLHDRGRPLHRACGFCAVATAKPLALEGDEPARVAEATRRMRLRHVVVTAVARDDLPDGGAEHFRQTIEAVRTANPGIIIEVLTPDFLDRNESIDTVLLARPHVFNHNLETVRRLTPSVRSRATYDRSLSVLGKEKARMGDTIHTKSGLMLGLGETKEELVAAMGDLRRVGCDILTLGQYLQPTLKHLPVAEYVAPEKFVEYGALAEGLGFVHVASGPMVRSSYHADEFHLPPPLV